ncbi:MAG: hypothetical protein WC674_11910 [Candidatus Krumholzibacteriia bacterium]
MKRMVLIAMGLLLLAGSGFARPYGGLGDSTYAGLPDTAYVGLFADVGHTVRSVTYGGTGFTPFTMYIFLLPSKMGLQGAEFKVSYPSNVMGTTVTQNPLIVIALGTLAAGISFTFAEEGGCRSDWVEAYHQACYLTSAAQSQIMVIEHPDILPFPAYEVITCELGYPIAPLKRFTHLSMNYDGGTAVESKSWGSIKSLFK